MKSRSEKEKASVTLICLEKPPYTIEVAAKPYLVWYVTPQFQKFDSKKSKYKGACISVT